MAQVLGGTGPRGGDWLEDEIQSWRRSGVDVVVSLLTREEQTELNLADEGAVCRANGIDFVSFPIVDRSVPSSSETFSEQVIKLGEQLANGKNVAVHCRQGIGRAALVAICVLISPGLAPAAAIARVGAARGCSVPETTEQRRWIADFAKSHVSNPSNILVRAGRPNQGVPASDAIASLQEMRTNVTFRHPAEFVGDQEDGGGVLAVRGALWFAALLRRVRGLELDENLCQEDWGVVFFARRNQKKYWIGLSEWDSEGVWLAHFHLDSSAWLQRLSSTGKGELERLLVDFHDILVSEPAISAIAWHEEREMTKPNPAGSLTPDEG